MKKNLISVIVPLYNFEEYIEKCLDSIASQTYDNYEVIIVDDGSKDNSYKVVEKYIKSKRLEKFKLISKDNGGVSSARNKGIEEASGEWITFVDADDFMSKDCLSELALSSSGYDYVIGNYYLYYNSKIVKNELYDTNVDNLKEEIIINLLNEKQAEKINRKRFNSMRNVWGKLYKRDIILKNNIRFNTKIKHFEDGLFNLEYLKNVESINMINSRIYYYYVDSSNSATKKFRDGIINEDKLKISKTKILIDDFSSNDISLFYEIFKFDLLSSYLLNYLFHPQNKEKISIKNKELKQLLEADIYNCFDRNISKLLQGNKKVVYFLLKSRLTLLICVILSFRNKIKRR